jgi:hypothetical protein
MLRCPSEPSPSTMELEDTNNVNLPGKVGMPADPAITASTTVYFAAGKLRIKSWFGRLRIEAKIRKRRLSE